jgi:tetratricopeptide (TPR) repeat protein
LFDLFKVLKRYPDDRDTQAYVMLLKAMHKKEYVSFDKLREIAPGFIFEVDLWLSQAYAMQQKGLSEYSSSLKCYEMAIECMAKQNIEVQRNVLVNMGVIQHNLGNLAEALRCVRLALAQECKNSSSRADSFRGHLILRCAENDIFYSWSPSSVPVIAASMETSDPSYGPLDCMIELDPSSALGLSLNELTRVGDDVLINDSWLLQVCEILPHSLHCRSPLPAPIGIPLTMKFKTYNGNFNTQTVTSCFNLARIQEDLGRQQAAREIYIALLNLHPAFIECRGPHITSHIAPLIL